MPGARLDKKGADKKIKRDLRRPASQNSSRRMFLRQVMRPFTLHGKRSANHGSMPMSRDRICKIDGLEERMA